MGFKTLWGLKRPFLTRLQSDLGPDAPTALLLVAASRFGKTSLARRLSEAGVPSIHLDFVILDLVRDERHYARPISIALRNAFDETEIGGTLGRVGRFIAHRGYAREFVEIVADMSPPEAETFCIEGDILRYWGMKRRMVSALNKRRVRAWVVTPMVI